MTSPQFLSQKYLREIPVWKDTRDKMEHWQRENGVLEAALTLKLTRTAISLMVIGSRADGLCSDQLSPTHRSDIDIAITLPSEYDIPAAGCTYVGGLVLQLDSRGTRPGYTRVRVLQDCDQLRNVIHNGHLKPDLYAWQRVLQSLSDVKFAADIHTPALRTEQDGLEVDNVLCLVCRSQLPGIKKWASRNCPPKKFWPPKDVRENVCNLPTLLVPVGHPTSRTQDMEWRISYSQAEMLVCRTIQDTARTAYIKLKGVIKKAFQGSRCVFKSYHLKTVLLWVLEKWGNTDMTEKEVSFRVMEKRECFLQERKIPHYFNPRVNLIDHLTRREVSKVVARVKSHSVKGNLTGNLIKTHLRTMRDKEARRFPRGNTLF